MLDVLPALLGGALIAGVLSGAHCATMCGGIVGAMQGHAPVVFHHSRRAALLNALISALPQNAGRLTAYALIGMLAGAAGSGWISFHDSASLRQALFAIANTLLITLGLSLMFGQQLANHAERLGGHLWRRIRPFAAKLMARPSPARRWMLGLLWGFMPCALVYAMLLSALATGRAAEGALLMLAFGLGTLPNLLAISLAWALPEQFNVMRIFASHGGAGAISFKAIAGAVMLAFGVFGLLRLPAIVKLHGMSALCHPVLQ